MREPAFQDIKSTRWSSRYLCVWKISFDRVFLLTRSNAIFQSLRNCLLVAFVTFPFRNRPVSAGLAEAVRASVFPPGLGTGTTQAMTDAMASQERRQTVIRLTSPEPRGFQQQQQQEQQQRRRPQRQRQQFHWTLSEQALLIAGEWASQLQTCLRPAPPLVSV